MLFPTDRRKYKLLFFLFAFILLRNISKPTKIVTFKKFSNYYFQNNIRFLIRNKLTRFDRIKCNFIINTSKFKFNRR